ncbi:hypothetical protein Hbl1158_16760 (plasmid) [Halobaculum sp. CBA1158]|uniref:hypothetical protein n=1 Tax=Halobaculum sp. CBA1158 TaxID=2904243 RepID=UPI001F4621B2|nr:hypothetical protein [Halobaculum sp. CBA1158]UIP01605.1 hypothetical protein Hbl1158_16760 [Halobaculum sp. CBA1158]
MSSQPTLNEESSGVGSDGQKYPFGLSSPLLFVVVVVIGIIGPGLAVYALDSAGLRLLSDIVWVTGYGTTIFVVWYIWLRPLDLTGSSGMDVSEIREKPADDEPAGEQADESPTDDGADLNETEDSNPRDDQLTDETTDT